jgi:hypothetical protein
MIGMIEGDIGRRDACGATLGIVSVFIIFLWPLPGRSRPGGKRTRLLSRVLEDIGKDFRRSWSRPQRLCEMG